MATAIGERIGLNPFQAWEAWLAAGHIRGALLDTEARDRVALQEEIAEDVCREMRAMIEAIRATEVGR